VKTDTQQQDLGEETPEANEEYIEVLGARVHNLKNIDVRIPRDKLVVITGLSGSGKSSLAFDTIHAEGQRRYIETFNAYARQFLGGIERPDVDLITGLSPVIAIEQKTISRNPRSTVGTITEVYDLLRLLYARVADAFSYETGEPMVRYSDRQIVDLIISEYEGHEVLILAPIVRGRKGHYRDLFEQLLRQGFLRARVDGKVIDLTTRPRLDRYKVHDIELVIDRLKVKGTDRKRLSGGYQERCCALLEPQLDVPYQRHRLRRAGTEPLQLQLALWRLSQMQWAGSGYRSGLEQDRT
jgi:excinuclease ABC subunit A